VNDEPGLPDVARAIIEANSYMTIATADERGVPWASPVWFAPAGDARFYWVSDPEARHSRNLAIRGEVGIVIFDSQAPIGTGQGVYVDAVAEQVTGAVIEPGIEAYSRRSAARGGQEWTRADVESPARMRLYCATVTEMFVLDEHDRRVQLTL
jgi:uncharacterized protein YhbP (UPF0306 family)